MITKPLTYRCPHCGTTTAVLPEAAGQVVVCPAPACGKPFHAEVPAARPEANPNGKPAAATTSTGKAPTVPTAVPVASQPAAVPELAGGPGQPPAPAPATGPPQLTLPTEVPLETVRVSMWRRYPFRCLVYILLIAASSIGAVIAVTQDLNVVALVCAAVLVLALCRFVPWWLRMRNTLLTITDRRCVLETGILHREATEFDRGDLIDVRVAQSGLMRLFNVGDLIISSDVDARKEFVLMAVPHPATVAGHLRDLKLGHEHHPAEAHQAQHA
jgi:hypothetical protein